jgi:hypothetical protein
MSEPILNEPRIVPRVGHRVAAGMPEHMRVDLEGESGALADALDQAIDGVRGERPAAEHYTDSDDRQ